MTYRYESQHSVVSTTLVNTKLCKFCNTSGVLTTHYADSNIYSHEWQQGFHGGTYTYKVMIKGGSHIENISACETQNHIGRLTRPFFRVWRETTSTHGHGRRTGP